MEELLKELLVATKTMLSIRKTFTKNVGLTDNFILDHSLGIDTLELVSRDIVMAGISEGYHAYWSNIDVTEISKDHFKTFWLESNYRVIIHKFDAAYKSLNIEAITNEYETKLNQIRLDLLEFSLTKIHIERLIAKNITSYLDMYEVLRNNLECMAQFFTNIFQNILLTRKKDLYDDIMNIQMSIVNDNLDTTQLASSQSSINGHEKLIESIERTQEWLEEADKHLHALKPIEHFNKILK